MMDQVALFTKPSVACFVTSQSWLKQERVPDILGMSQLFLNLPLRSRFEHLCLRSTGAFTSSTQGMPRIHARVALVADHPHSHRVHECTVSIRPSRVHPMFSAQILISNPFRPLPHSAVASEVDHEGQHIRMTRRGNEQRSSFERGNAMLAIIFEFAVKQEPRSSRPSNSSRRAASTG